MSQEPRIRFIKGGTVVGSVWEDSNGDLVLEEEESGERLTVGSAGVVMDALEAGGINAEEINGAKHITSVDDLPDPSNGTHTLEDNTVYCFDTTVTSDAALEVGDSSPLIGNHREHDWFVYTGGSGAAIRATGVDTLVSQLGLNAPGGEIFDVDGNSASDVLVENVFLANDQDYADSISSLGTIDGAESCEFHNTGFRDFDTGFDFMGAANYVKLNGCEFRDPTGTNTALMTFTSSFTCESVQLNANHIRSLDPDTTVVHAATDASFNQVFLYSDNTHDTSVTQSEIFTGQADASKSPFWVTTSFPLRNSAVIGEVGLDSETTTTFPAVGEWVEVTGSTSVGNEAQRTQSDGTGGIEYTGDKETNVQISMSISWTGANGDEYQFAVAKNGTPEPTSMLPQTGGGGNSNQVSAITSIEDLAQNDRISLMVRNVDSTSSITVSRYNINFMGQ